MVVKLNLLVNSNIVGEYKIKALSMIFVNFILENGFFLYLILAIFTYPFRTLYVIYSPIAHLTNR